MQGKAATAAAAMHLFKINENDPKLLPEHKKGDNCLHW